jgi:hypothetical protein
MPEVLVEWLGRFNLAGLVDEKMPDLPRKCAV